LSFPPRSIIHDDSGSGRALVTMKLCRKFRPRAREALVAFAAAALVGCLHPSGAPAASATPRPPAVAAAKAPSDGLLAVQPTDTPSGVFLLQGRPFCFSGANNYYLTYKNEAMVDDVFAQAKAMGLEVLRTWAFIDRGALDDSVASTDRNDWEPYGTKNGVYFQYWDTSSKAVAYNEGKEKDDGLTRLDYVLSKAAEHGLKVVLVLTNNWKEFGGMDQYLKWFNLEHHHQFYTDAQARQAYKNYAARLINRVNTITNVVYRNDPNIFAWELANEPRCRNFGPYDHPDGCQASTLTGWVKEMSEYIKSIDPNHMVAVGDEGFFNRPGQSSDQYNGKEGVDHEAFLALPSIDYGTFHLYPDTWATSVKWANQWIIDHVAAAQKAGKPTVLEEYGIMVKREEKTGRVVGGYDRRRTAYVNWNNLLRQGGGNASMFWMLAGIDPGNSDTGQYPDLDHFAVYNLPEDDSAKLLRDVASQFTGARACQLANARGVAGSPSPFVSTAAPQSVAAAPVAHPLAVNTP
jgi:endo-1,4-beta-mannosidase